jgi:hypothetical protein
MVISGSTAAIVVLVKDGEAWRGQNAETRPFPSDGGEPIPNFPVILDASAWRTALGAGVTFESDLPRNLRAAGWDVRPPLWREGKAANATREEFEAAMAADGFAGIQFAPDVSADVLTAFALACWGAMVEASAELPPQPIVCRDCNKPTGNVRYPDGSETTIGHLCPTLLTPSAPDLRALLATGDVRGLPASNERALDLATIERQRDEAEAALLAIVAAQPWAEDDVHGEWCMHCDAYPPSPWVGKRLMSDAEYTAARDVSHKPGCAWVAARELLQRRGRLA